MQPTTRPGSPPTADKKPNLARLFTGALLLGLAYTIEHTSAAGQILAKAQPQVDATVAAAELELMRPYVITPPGQPIGVIDPIRAAKNVATLQGQGLMPNIRPEDANDFTLVPRKPDAASRNLRHRVRRANDMEGPRVSTPSLPSSNPLVGSVDQAAADPAAPVPAAETATEAHLPPDSASDSTLDRLRPYPMDNTHPASQAHHRALADLFDPHTIGRIGQVDVDLDGAACLEVGAGAGSIACWLAEQVGPTGQVTATDLNPDQIPIHPRLRVLKHDLTGGIPLPHGPFRLIHARLVLGHLLNRDLILRELAHRLEPGGGWLLVEDFAALHNRHDIVLCAPTPADADLYIRYQTAVGTVFDAHGTDPSWARRMHRAFTTAGLVDVHTSMHATDWAGGSPGAALTAATLTQLRPYLLHHGLTGTELDHLAVLLDDPAMVVHGHPLYATSAHTPH